METIYCNTFADEWGPAKIVHLFEPSLPLKAIVVIDNIALGPAIGGVRIAPDLSTEEVFRLARTMTWKNAAAGLPHGGGKAGIVMASTVAGSEKERAIRGFARAIADLKEYIPGPDMGTDETCMAYIYDEIQRSVGRPKITGGIPLDELGVTGFGLAVAAEQIADHLGISLRGLRVAVQGFGSVGRAVARFLEQRGCLLVAASDSTGAIYNPKGIDPARLIAVKKDRGRVLNYPDADAIPLETLFTLPCDILVPAARPDAITMANASCVQARIVLQGANIPVTPEAESYFQKCGISTLPDFIVNAGGVICTAVEYRRGSAAEAFQTITEKIKENCRTVLHSVQKDNLSPREAAYRLAQYRVRQASRYQRHF